KRLEGFPLEPNLITARALLLDETPLVRNCGSLCGAACWEGDETQGMLLFPGEEELDENCTFGHILTPGYRLGGQLARLFVCRGTCPREQRPLACRLFPLFLKVEGDSVRVIPDPRARGLCPLYASGITGLRTSFVEAVRAASVPLMQSPAIRAFLTDLTREMLL
ncbi:MAG: hypothetical protein IJ088_14865, partial [Clostridia bacterium]|nr:hypothetical protein [Clostridia bacterium]